MTDIDLSFVTTAEQAERLSAVPRGAISFSMKRARFDELGLGLGLADQHEALINFDGRARLWRLIRVDHDPGEPSVVGTGWVPALRPTNEITLNCETALPG